MESYKVLFHKNPTIDPITGSSVKIGSKEYLKLVKKYGEVKIKSPKTGSKITIGKGEYNKLLKEGYKEEELLYPTTKEYKNVEEKEPKQNINEKNYITAKQL